MYQEAIEMRNEFARNLKNKRKDAGLTQKQLAERAGMSHPVIVRYEAGRALPRPKAINALATALNINPNELIVQQRKKMSAKLNVVLTVDVKSLLDAELMIKKIKVLSTYPQFGKRSVSVEDWWISSITMNVEEM